MIATIILAAGMICTPFQGTVVCEEASKSEIDQLNQAQWIATLQRLCMNKEMRLNPNINTSILREECLIEATARAKALRLDADPKDRERAMRFNDQFSVQGR
jgi:hypothetical protein